jgi:PBSX family phage terminase large subunit
MLKSLDEIDISDNLLKIMWGDPKDLKRFPGLSTHQLALYHRVPELYAEEMKRKRMTKPLASWPRFKYVFDIGGVGSGKTFAGCFVLWVESLFIPGNFWVVIRKHHQELRNTVIRTFEQVGDMLTDGHHEYLMQENVSKEDGAIEYKIITSNPQKPSLIVFRIEPDGDREKIETTFRGPDQGGFWMEEANQLTEFTFDTECERVRLNGTSMRGLVTSNPPDGNDHWVAKAREKAEKEFFDWIPWIGRETDPMAAQKPRILSLTRKTEDNPTLPAEYITDLKDKYKNDPIGYSMFILGKAGERADGEGVFKNQFSYDAHVRDSIKYNPYRDLLVGWDFGFRTPAAIFAQVDEEERLNVLSEVVGDKQYVEAFCDDVRAHMQRLFPNHKAGVEHWGDIAGEQVKDTGASIARALERGFMIRTTFVGEIMEGVDLIRKMLSEERGGGVTRAPRLVVHPRCTRLIKALAGGYHFKKLNDGRFLEKPFKDNINDHPIDALRYLIVNHFGLNDARTKTPRGQMKAKRTTRLGS